MMKWFKGAAVGILVTGAVILATYAGNPGEYRNPSEVSYGNPGEYSPGQLAYGNPGEYSLGNPGEY
ncbi:hypothetical protein [Marinithermofilum abyssi]|nr:hypothetical protein [Marinithermofilum abyssi]